jgi:hypothetical protein
MSALTEWLRRQTSAAEAEAHLPINGTIAVVLLHSVSFPSVLFVGCGLVYGGWAGFLRTAEAAVAT